MAEDKGRATEAMEVKYPIYRRTSDGRHFYRVEALDRFTEIQVVGNRHLLHHVTARAYPELVRIMEMIDGSKGRYAEMEQDVWEVEFRRCTTTGS